MRGTVPNRPSGSSSQARWCQWVHDSIFSFLRVGQVRGAKVSSTTSGIFVEPLDLGGGGAGSRVRQYVLTDASNGDYFICRTLGQRTEGEGEDATILPAIGATDIFIAKPFHLRQSAFDRDVLNEETPGNIGTVDEITYDVEVEAWDGVTFSSSTKKLSHEYKSATFRIATDATDADPDNWTDQNQTIIPRFVPALLDEPDGGDITTETIAPTIIYAAKCPWLGVTRPDDPELPEEEQTQIAIGLLAINDGWAWSK